MIVTTDLLKELFKGFTVQRWNDKIRTVELIEIDKHAHKMFIAYILGKYEEQTGNLVDWSGIIKAGIYELLRRIVISDIKSPIFYKIKLDYPKVFEKLNEWVFQKINLKIGNDSIKEELRQYLMGEDNLDLNSSKILEAAHIYSSFWEFQKIIKHANPDGYQINQIERDLLASMDKHMDLIGMQKILTKRSVSDFIDLFGQLRFQIRWSQTPRLPKTSVLGHSMFVACISYFFAIDNNACPRRLYNDFFGGLFHDLPEAVTRDIISPVKSSSEEFKQLIQDIEADLADKEIFPLIEQEWHSEIKYFTRDEFANKYINLDGQLQTVDSTDILNSKYNKDSFNPKDGELIKAADRLAAYIEAWSSVQLGIKSDDLQASLQSIPDSLLKVNLGATNIKQIFEGFN